MENASLKTIRLDDELVNDSEVISYINRILKKYSIVYYKTMSNIEDNKIENYIELLKTSRKVPSILDGIDKKKLLEEIYNRRSEILGFVDENIYNNVVVTAIENMLLTTVVMPFNHNVGMFLLFYTLISPVPYTVIPRIIDNFNNKKKYKYVVSEIESCDVKLKPNLNILCIISREIYTLQNTSGVDFTYEIAKLRSIAKEYY